MDRQHIDFANDGNGLPDRMLDRLIRQQVRGKLGCFAVSGKAVSRIVSHDRAGTDAGIDVWRCENRVRESRGQRPDSLCQFDGGVVGGQGVIRLVHAVNPAYRVAMSAHVLPATGSFHQLQLPQIGTQEIQGLGGRRSIRQAGEPAQRREAAVSA